MYVLVYTNADCKMSTVIGWPLIHAAFLFLASLYYVLLTPTSLSVSQGNAL